MATFKVFNLILDLNVNEAQLIRICEIEMFKVRGKIGKKEGTESESTVLRITF